MKEFKNVFSDSKAYQYTLILSFFYILPLLLLNIWYMDDNTRILNGYNWNHDGRFVASYLSRLITFTEHTFDFFPYSLILSAFILGTAGYILCILWSIEKNNKIKWSSLFVLISPFYLANLPYRYDCIYMSLSILLLIIPYVHFHQKKCFIIFSIIGIFLSLGLFQPSVSIYFIVGFVFIFHLVLQDQWKTATKKLASILLAFFIALILYRLFLLVTAIDVTDNRMKMILFESNFVELLFLKWNMFYENWILLMTTNGYQYLFFSFLTVPFIYLFFVSNKTSILKYIAFFLLTLAFVVLLIILIPGGNLILKASYLPMRALPALGVVILSFLSFSYPFNKYVLMLCRGLIVIHVIFCFNLMAQLGNTFYFQKQYHENVTTELSDLVRTYNVKKIAIHNYLGPAPKSKKLYYNYPILNAVANHGEISENSLFTKSVLDTYGVFHNVELIPYESITSEKVMLVDIYPYKFYKVDTETFVIELNRESK